MKMTFYKLRLLLEAMQAAAKIYCPLRLIVGALFPRGGGLCILIELLVRDQSCKTEEKKSIFPFCYSL